MALWEVRPHDSFPGAGSFHVVRPLRPVRVVAHDPQDQHPEVSAISWIVDPFAARAPLDPRDAVFERRILGPVLGPANDDLIVSVLIQRDLKVG